MSIADNVARIRERIAAAAARAGRRVDEITLVAVSKTFPAECIRDAYATGVRHFGENRVQEWESKAAQLADLRDATWHLVGHLQSNKARRAIELFTTVDSVDSIALAQRLDRIVAERFTAEVAEDAEKSDVGAGLQTDPKPSQNMNTEARREQGSQRKLPILLEVRLAPEETKHGVEPLDLPAMVAAVRALPHLDLRGLMCIPPWCANPEDARPYFRRLRELRDSLRSQVSCHSEGVDAMRRDAVHRATEERVSIRRSVADEPQGLGLDSYPSVHAPPALILPELSMGMSHDFAVAIEEGATQIRLGTAIFGERS